MRDSEDGTVAQVVDIKGVTLLCRLPSGKEGSIHGISFNRKTERKFRKGDQVSVIVTSPNPFQIVLTKEYVKPLLIFDMHGVLGEREPFQKGKPRRFLRRPHSQDFIRFCAERFEIAVWSCALKKNIDLKMFQGIKLIFVWTQDESTNLYPFMSTISEHKPLFLKELSTVWAKFPSYDSSNTILLDNHVEKCERNPAGTCLIVPDFVLDTPDDVISPRGIIATHLQAMAAGHPEVSLSSYMSDRAGSCSLFPSSYQTSASRRVHPDYTEPLEPPLGVDTVPDELTSLPRRIEKTCFQDKHSEAKKIRKVDRNVLVVNVLTSILGNDVQAIDQIFEDQYMPILARKHLFREDISKCLGDEGEVMVCDAMVGESVYLVVDPASRKVSFLFSNLSVRDVSPPEIECEQEEWFQWMEDMAGGMSVFIGELGRAASADQSLFFCLDALVLNGIATAGKDAHTGNLCDRIGRASGWFFNSPLDEVSVSIEGSPLLLSCKEYYPVSRLPDLLSRITSSPGHGSYTLCSVADGGVAYECDGVVFTHSGDSIAHKWQPAQTCTLSVRVSASDLLCALTERGYDWGTSSVSVLGEYQHLPSSSLVRMEVIVMESDIPREVMNMYTSGAGEDLTDSYVVACVPRGDGLWVALHLQPRWELSCDFSLEEPTVVQRVHSENIALSELVT